MVMIGDHGANSWFCHKRCSNNLYSRFIKKQKEECKGKIDIDHVKEAAWDNVIASMNETLPSVAKDTAQKMKFPIRISSVNVTKSVGNCEFGHI